MRTVGAVCCVCALVACATPRAEVAATPQAATTTAPSPHADLLRELLPMLPAGADHCVLARPSRIAATERERVMRVSQAESFAWLRDLDVQGYASVLRERRDGPSALVVLARVSLAPDATRELLDRRAGLRLQWSDVPCAEPSCGPRARFVAPSLLRIERGVFPEGSAQGAEVRCARLAAESPDAVELTATRNRSLDELPLRASTLVRASASGLHVSRVELMPSMVAAAEAARASAQLAPIYATNVRTEVADLELRTELDVRFEDLALAEQDDARLRSAELEADQREQVSAIPAGSEEPRTREDLLAELGYRLERASLLTGGERDAEIATTRALLERAIATQPDDEGLAALLAELLVTTLHDAAAARAVLARFVRPGPGGSRVGALLRQAAALEGDVSLARELVAQQIVPRAAAQKVARSILGRVRAGAGYVEAERTVLAETAPRPAPVPAPEGP